MSRRVRVHAFLAAATVSQSGLHPTSNLLGVDYWHEVPADVEFPRVIGRLDLFTRFYLRNAHPTEFLVAIRWLDSSTRQGRRPVRFGPFTVNFQPNEFVRDHSFRVINIRLGGVGARSKTKLEGASVRSARRNATVCAEVGIPYVEISEELGMLDDEVEKLWKQARRKLGTTLFGTPTTLATGRE